MSVQTLQPVNHSSIQAPAFTIYTIRDVKSNIFNTPFVQTHKIGALRQFEQLVRDPQSMISKYPADFQLYEIGEFNSQDGRISSHDVPVFIANATDFNQ